MGNNNSAPQSTSPLIVEMDGKSAVIFRYMSYDDAVSAVKGVSTFKAALENREIYFTVQLPEFGEGEFEVTRDAWAQVLDSVTHIKVKVVGVQDDRPRPKEDIAPPYEQPSRLK